MRSPIAGSLIFATGALFGLGVGFYFGFERHSGHKIGETADYLTTPTLVVAASPEGSLEAPAPFPPNNPESIATKSSAEDMQSEELRARALRDLEDLRDKERQAEDLRAQPPQEPVTPAAIEGPAPQPVAPEIPTPVMPEPPPGLLIPVAGIKTGQLSDTFTDSRGSGRVHDAIDIMAPRGTPVIAADDGKVIKLFHSVPGGLTVYEFDRGEKFAYYYAHLSGYAPGVVEGKQLKRGDLIGYVGSTGNASVDAPHLHFAIFVLGPKKQWWEGTAVNPYPLLRER